MKYMARAKKATTPRRWVQILPVSVWIRNIDLKHSLQSSIAFKKTYKTISEMLLVFKGDYINDRQVHEGIAEANLKLGSGGR